MKERSKSWTSLFGIAARISAWKINGRRAMEFVTGFGRH